MLKKAWDSVAHSVSYGVARIGQSLDRAQVDALNTKIENARDRREIVSYYSHAYWGPITVHRQELSEQEAARIVEETTNRRQAVEERMAKRAAKYNFS